MHADTNVKVQTPEPSQSPAGAQQTSSAQAQAGELFQIDPSILARRREDRVVLVSRVLLGIVLLGGWQLASGTIVKEFWVSSPTGVVLALVKLWQSGSLATYTLATVNEAITGFVFGAIAGMLLGLVFGTSRLVARILDPYLVGFSTVPRVALIPLMVLWFGIGFQTKVIFTALLVFFPVFMNTLAGIRDVDQDLIDVIRVMGASRFDTLMKVLVPSALVWLFAGLRISAPYALIGAVVGEMFTSNAGLGYLLSQSAAQFDTGALFATLLVITLLGLVLTVGLDRLERNMLRWQTHKRN
jgi:NitT/TauT family transport system permease protein